jgi:hypothetical protein
LLTALNNPQNEGTRGFPRGEQFQRRAGRVWLSLGTRGKTMEGKSEIRGKNAFPRRGLEAVPSRGRSLGRDFENCSESHRFFHSFRYLQSIHILFTPMIFSPGQRLQIRNRFRTRQEKMRILFLSARKKNLTEKPL